MVTGNSPLKLAVKEPVVFLGRILSRMYIEVIPKVVVAPVSEAITPLAIPTGPVPPKTTTLQSAMVLVVVSASAFSTQATNAAAVVKAPLGSARTETSKGGTIARLLAVNMS